MKIKAIIASIGLTVAAAGALTVGLVSNNSGDKEAKAVDFSTETITRRVYFVNNEYYGAHWYKDYYKFVKAESLDGSKSYVSELATTIYGSYYDGLFYADVTFAGVGDSIKVQITTDRDYGPDHGETSFVTIPALSDKIADCVWINNGSPTYGKADLGASEAKCVLDHIQTCEDSYASGYNAYPQLIANFNILNVSGLSDQSIGDKDKEGHGGYNAYDKIVELGVQYSKKGW